MLAPDQWKEASGRPPGAKGGRPLGSQPSWAEVPSLLPPPVPVGMRGGVWNLCALQRKIGQGPPPYFPLVKNFGTLDVSSRGRLTSWGIIDVPARRLPDSWDIYPWRNTPWGRVWGWWRPFTHGVNSCTSPRGGGIYKIRHMYGWGVYKYTVVT